MSPMSNNVSGELTQLSVSNTVMDREELTTKLEANIARFEKAKKKALKRWHKANDKIMLRAIEELQDRQDNGHLTVQVAIAPPRKPELSSHGLYTFTARMKDDVRDQVSLSYETYREHVYCQWLEELEKWRPTMPEDDHRRDKKPGRYATLGA